MKTITPILLSFLLSLPSLCSGQVSSNKSLVVGTNNVLRWDSTNFFTTNIFPLTNALFLAGYGAGGGGGGGSASYFSPNLDTNGSGKIDLANTIAPTNINSSGWWTVAGNQSNGASLFVRGPSYVSNTLTVQTNLTIASQFEANTIFNLGTAQLDDYTGGNTFHTGAPVRFDSTLVVGGSLTAPNFIGGGSLNLWTNEYFWGTNVFTNVNGGFGLTEHVSTVSGELVITPGVTSTNTLGIDVGTNLGGVNKGYGFVIRTNKVDIFHINAAGSLVSQGSITGSNSLTITNSGIATINLNGGYGNGSAIISQSAGTATWGILQTASSFDIQDQVTLAYPLVVNSADNVLVSHVLTASNFYTLDPSSLSNSAFGYLALNPATTGGSNVAFGDYALAANSTGAGNVALGEDAMLANTTGWYNTAVGYDALAALVGGNWYNVAMGDEAMKALTSGQYNTALGDRALADDLAPNYNVVIGSEADYNSGNSGGHNWSNTVVGTYAMSLTGYGTSNNVVVGADAAQNLSGSGNTVVGTLAGNALVNGSNNIFLGFMAGINNTNGSNCIYIGNQGSASDTNIIVIGSNQTNTTIAGVINGNGLGLTNIQAANVVGGVTGTTNFYHIDVTNQILWGGGQSTLNANGSITQATTGPGNSFDGGQWADDGNGNITANSFSGNGSAVTSLNASHVTSGTLGSNYLQTVFSNIANHYAGVPTVSLDLGVNSAVTIPGGSGILLEPGYCDYGGKLVLTNGNLTGTNTAAYVLFTNTFKYPFNNPPSVTFACGTNTSSGFGAEVARIGSDLSVAATSTTNFIIYISGSGTALAASTTYEMLITVQGQ